MVAVPSPTPRVHAISAVWPHMAPTVCPKGSEWERGRWGWILERKHLSMIVPSLHRPPPFPELNVYLHVL